jgi:hypothetical protein
LGDIPEVRALRESVQHLFDALILTLSKDDYLATFAEGGDEVNEAWRRLRAALAAFADKGEEPKR